MVSMVWKPIFFIFAASTSVHAIKWTKHEVLHIFDDVFDDTPLECSRENGYDLNNIDDEAFLVFNEAMEELDRPMIKANVFSMERLKKYTVTYTDGHTEMLNLLLCSVGRFIGNYFYLKKLGDDEFCIYTTPTDFNSVVRMLRQKIHWTEVEVSSILLDPVDSLPLDSNQENGYNFIADYDVHFVGAMKELGRPIFDIYTLDIEPLKKYTVKHKDGRTEMLNLVKCLGGGSLENNFYLQKVGTYDFRIYVAVDDVDDFSSITHTHKLPKIRWTKKEVLSITPDPAAVTSLLEYSRQNGYFFHGNYETHFIGAMKVLGRPVMIDYSFMIRRVRKYEVEYGDGRIEELNLVQFTGGSVLDNVFYLQRLGKNNYCIYTLIEDDNPCSAADSLECFHWSKKEVSSITSNPAGDGSLDFSRQKGYYFEGKYDTHFLGAMREMGRPLISAKAIIITKLREYVVKYENGRSEKLNLVRFDGGSEPGNRFYLQELDESYYCIYTVIGEDGPSSSTDTFESIRWIKKEVLSIIPDPVGNGLLEYNQQNGYYFEGNYHSHFVGAMRELGRRQEITGKLIVISKLRKYTVKYDDGQTEELNLVRFSVGTEPGNEFYLQELDQNNFCIYTEMNYDNPSAIQKLVNIRWTKKEVLAVYRNPDGDDELSQFDKGTGYYFEGKYHPHFVGAMKELGRPILQNTLFRISDLKKYTIKYRDDRTEQLNLVRFVGGSEPGNRFYLQEVEEDNFCIYTVFGDDSITPGGPSNIMYRTKKEGFKPYFRPE